MTTHVALLRGVNVGKAKRIAMSELRSTFEALGFERVRTLLASGNVVFDAKPKDANAPRIAAAIRAELGVECPVVVLPAAELDALLAANPFADSKTDASRRLVVVLASKADAKALAPLVDRSFGRERLALGPRAAYLDCPDGILAGELWKSVDRAVRDRGTARNVATLSKLTALAAE